MLDATFTAAQVIEKHVPHEPPAQTRSPAQCGIHIGGADDAFGNKIVNLPIQSGLQTVGNMTRHILAHSNRPPSNAVVEFRDALKGLLGGLGATHNFYQRDEMGGIERMSNDATLRVGTAP